MWIRHYERGDLRYDFMAGLTVSVMLIPQAMAYAMLAGLPPVYGLYASIIPPILYALFGTSRQLSVGPAAMVSLITASGIGLIADAGTSEYLALVALMTLTVGIIQFSLGIARLGFLVNFLSNPVILGFTTAAAIIIILSQLKFLFGIQYPGSQLLHVLMTYFFTELPYTHWITLLMGAGSIAFLIWQQKKYPTLPGALLLLVMAMIITWAFSLDLHGVKIIGNIKGQIPKMSLPAMDWANVTAVLSTAFSVALVGFMESTAIARAIQARHRTYHIEPDKELMSLGLANIMSGLFRSLPVTGGLSRSLVNDQAGARSGMSSIITSGLLLVVTLIFSSTFYYVPLTVLAAIIISAAIKLFRWHSIRRLWVIDTSDFWMMTVTFCGTLFFGISMGILVGVFLSLSWIIYTSSNPHHAELGRVAGTQAYRNIRRFDEVEIPTGILIYRYDAPLFFANAQRFKDALFEYKKHRLEKIHSIVIDFESVFSIDSSALSVLREMIEDLLSENIKLYLAEIKGPVRDKLYRSGITDMVGIDHFFASVAEAVQFAEGREDITSHPAAWQYDMTRKDLPFGI